MGQERTGGGGYAFGKKTLIRGHKQTGKRGGTRTHAGIMMRGGGRAKNKIQNHLGLVKNRVG